MSNLNDSSDSSVDEGWISWFCSLDGNNFFCEVDRGYIEDAFNLFGLKAYFRHPEVFSRALDVILDKDTANDEEDEELSASTELLYGLIHARYIITAHGLETMALKYRNGEFGECPRHLCGGQVVLPMGLSTEPQRGSCRLFCPRCQDIYVSRDHRHIDGAFFGPTFPGMFYMTHESLVPTHHPLQYTPRVFGFKIHRSSRSRPDYVVSHNNGTRTKSLTQANVNEATSSHPSITSTMLTNVASSSGAGGLRSLPVSLAMSSANGKTFVTSRGDKGIMSSKQQQQQQQPSNTATSSSRLVTTTSSSSVTATIKPKINQEDNNNTSNKDSSLSMEKGDKTQTKNKISNEKRGIEEDQNQSEVKTPKSAEYDGNMKQIQKKMKMSDA